MKTINILWVDDDLNFGPSIHFRVEDDLLELKIELAISDQLQDGKYIWDTVRDLRPDIIMMDHNLQDVLRNGANLITEIRFHDNEVPIIFYSTEMGPELMRMVQGSDVLTSTRADVHSELMRLIREKFA